MQVVFFPKNKLSASVCNLYNGHVAAMNLNTDRLKDGKYVLDELEACRNNLRITSFLNPRFDYFEENDPATYGAELRRLQETGIWNWGIYFNTNTWWNPFTDTVEIIPGQGQSVWTQSVADFWNAHGANITPGASKTTSSPAHGGGIYSLTNGRMGFDNTTGSWGSETGGSETLVWAQKQIEICEQLTGKRLTGISYMNGITALLPPMLIPIFLSGRNSSYSFTGNSNINSGVHTRMGALNRPISCRAWDAQRAGQFATQADAIAFSCGELQRAIDSLNPDEKLFSEFRHTHSFYELNDLPFIANYAAAINNQIGTQDVWRAGWGEAFEYLFLRDSIKKVGSFVHGSDVYISYHAKDYRYKGTNSYGVPNDLPMSFLDTPISLKVDLTGTPLDGQNIICPEAKVIRNMGSNVWVISTPYRIGTDGYGLVKLSAGTQQYYSATKPTIIQSGNLFTSDVLAKWVVWRKPTSGGLADIKEVTRDNDLKMSFAHVITTGYDYYIGAVSQFGHSSLLEI